MPKGQDATPTVCPHCGNTFHRSSHVAKCPDNPAIRATVAQLLTDASNGGCIVSEQTYTTRAQSCGLPVPCRQTLRNLHGSWDNVAVAFGLPDRTDKPPTLKVCEHCGQPCHPKVIAAHEAHCLHRPDVKALVRRYAEGDMPGVAVGIREYRDRVEVANRTAPKGQRAPAVQTLRQHLGVWAAIVNWCGLITEDQAIDRQSAIEVQKEIAQMAAERALLAQDAERAYMLPVLEVRPAPGLRVNGRECVRCVLR
jgi:hypothetical protein